MVFGILGPPYCGIGATIRIGREMLCLPYAGFLIERFAFVLAFEPLLQEVATWLVGWEGPWLVWNVPSPVGKVPGAIG